MFGKIARLFGELVLISTCLAGLKRSSGLSPALGKIPSKDLRQLFISYLELGEYCMDLAIVLAGRSSSFERRR